METRKLLLTDMKQQLLNNSNIFVLGASAYVKSAGEDDYIIYSPLAKDAALVTERQVESYERWLVQCADGEAAPDPVIVRMLNYRSHESQLKHLESPDDIVKISVLPTHACNLSCTYCYSALGRTKTTLSESTLKAALDYFFKAGRVNAGRLHLSFIGGGEPLLSWPLVRSGFEYADELAGKSGLCLDKTLITNGTIVTDDIISFISEREILPNISFDILERHQERQRGSYSKVAANIKKMLASGLSPAVNATITPYNVDDMGEMMHTVINEYPGVKSLIFEPVVNLSFFSDMQAFDVFHQSFTRHFFEARSIGLSHDIDLVCKAFINMFNLTSYGCETRFSLTPEGFITNCYCVSSPAEKHFKNRVIGQVEDDGTVVFDKQKFSDMMRDSVDTKERCRTCFLKYNCGGGCLLANEQYTGPYFDVLCNNIRHFSAKTLVEKYQLDKQNGKQRTQ